MHTSDDLIYPGFQNEMDPEPVNISLSETATALIAGETVLVVLEPGDATRYNLCVVPCWAQFVGVDALASCGISDPSDYLLVTKFDSTEGNSWFARHLSFEADVAPGIKNRWSRTLLAWWTRRLWREIRTVLGTSLGQIIQRAGDDFAQ